LKVEVRVESALPKTLLRYGKLRLHPAVLMLARRRGKRLEIHLDRERLLLPVDKYGRITIPTHVVERAARGKQLMVVKASSKQVNLTFEHASGD